MSVPPGAILGGLTILTSFVISPTVVTVPNTDWEEATLLWLTISMPTGSRKSTVYQFLRKLLHDIRIKAGCKGMLIYNFITVKQMCMCAIPHVLQLLLYNHISCAYTLDSDPIWLFQDSTFEKMGMHMADNGGRLLGMFDELSAFLTKIKLYSSRGLTDSHELSMFLELYNGNSWNRTTG